jgi:hypothetical protein
MTVTINGSAGVTTNSGAVYNGLQTDTAKASTSGTSIDFTGIPSWVKRITVMFQGVSTNGTSHIQIQLGDSGGVETTGYLGTSTTIQGTAAGTTAFTAGFGIRYDSAAGVRHGAITISLLNSSTNAWAAAGVIATSDTAGTIQTAGTKALSDILTTLRITTVNGTDTFDAGTVNIIYE